MTQALQKASPSPFQAMAHGLLVPCAEDLEFARPRVDAEHGAGEIEGLAVVNDVGGVEDAVPSVEPAVGAPRQRIGKLVGVVAAEAADDDFLLVGLAGPLGVLEEEDVGRVGHPDAAVAEVEAGGDVEAVGEDRDLVERAVAVGVFEDFNTIFTRPGGGARVFEALRDPEASAFVEGHGDGVDDIRLAGDEFDGEAVGDGHFFDGVLRRQGGAGHLVLAVGDRLGLGRLVGGGRQHGPAGGEQGRGGDGREQASASHHPRLPCATEGILGIGVDSSKAAAGGREPCRIR